VRACPDAFLLGAIAPDGPFYCPEDPRVVAIATRLHGKDADDAFAPVKRAMATGAAGGAAQAFAAGVLCHIAGDAVFHPAVFYFTGFPAHASPKVRGSYLHRHRSFESALDLHLLGEHGDLPRRLDRVLAGARTQPGADELMAAVARCYTTAGEPLSPATAARILARAGRTQRVFFSPWLRLLLRLRHLGHAGKNRDTSALFYSREPRSAATFTSPRPYRDPVTGADGIFDVRALLGRAAATAASLCQSLERSLAGDTAAFPHPGPSLESGHPLDQDQQMKYCDPILTADEPDAGTC
jgi:hypothetical protein